MVARYFGDCSAGADCKVSSTARISPGQDITWNRRVKGSLYHVECFGPEQRKVNPSTPAPAPVAKPTPVAKPQFATPATLDEILEETPATAPGSDLFKLLAKQLTPYLDARLSAKVDEQQVREIVAELVKEPLVREVVVVNPNKVKTNVGMTHKSFDKLLFYVSRRRSVYMYGPMGTGKSHAANQVATALNLQYAYVSLNPQSPASLLSGFVDAHGRYIETDFYRCYRDGGVFCIDELDNASPSLLTTLNSALANNFASFPCGMVQKHVDFVLVATGNTSGRGGDWQYPERRKIDEATLDRLTFVYWGHDTALEMELARMINPKAEKWVEWVWAVREWCGNKANGIRGGVYATARAILAGADDLAGGLTYAEIADTTVFKGLDNDTKVKILAANPLP